MWCNFYIPALNSAPYYHLLFPDYNKLCLVPFWTLPHKFSSALNPRSAFPVIRFLHVPFKHVFKAISSVPRFKQSVDFTILNTTENLRNACCYPPLNKNLCHNNGQLTSEGSMSLACILKGFGETTERLISLPALRIKQRTKVDLFTFMSEIRHS